MDHMFSIGERSGERTGQGSNSNLVIDEEPLDNACHEWSHIILLKYGCGQALNIRKHNWLQHLGDIAMAV
ncbi:hypothetical protein TNCV_2353311 [Trichonephila clavipes]|nr:hypothetical protein TNCV_2353311 [Trichonephila clavipes]